MYEWMILRLSLALTLQQRVMRGEFTDVKAKHIFYVNNINRCIEDEDVLDYISYS